MLLPIDFLHQIVDSSDIKRDQPPTEDEKMRKEMATKKSIYEEVTDRIIEAIETEGILPWRKSWTSYGGDGLPRNFTSMKTYRGINLFLLMMSHHSAPYWLTYKQAQALGGTVRKGEKGTRIIFWSKTKKEDLSGKEQEVFFAKTYTVFNVLQCEGIENPEEEKPELKEHEKIDICESIVRGYDNPPEFRTGGDQPYYSLLQDYIQMPVMGAFDSAQEYYATLFHECVHSTGHKKRLARIMPERVGSNSGGSYGKEELVAELGAAYLCAKASISQVTEDNSASYLNGWIKLLKGNSRLIVDAASASQKAVDYILGDR